MEFTQFISGSCYSASISCQDKEFKLRIFPNENARDKNEYEYTFNKPFNFDLHGIYTKSLTLTPHQFYNVVSECLVGKGLMEVKLDQSLTFTHATFNFGYFGEAVSIHIESPKNNNQDVKVLQAKLDEYKIKADEYQEKFETLQKKVDAFKQLLNTS